MVANRNTALGDFEAGPETLETLDLLETAEESDDGVQGSGTRPWRRIVAVFGAVFALAAIAGASAWRAGKVAGLAEARASESISEGLVCKPRPGDFSIGGMDIQCGSADVCCRNTIGTPYCCGKGSVCYKDACVDRITVLLEYKQKVDNAVGAMEEVCAQDPSLITKMCSGFGDEPEQVDMCEQAVNSMCSTKLNLFGNQVQDSKVN